MASAIIHAQMLLHDLDDVAEEQDLFKQDYKKKVKNLIFETESKLNAINNNLTEEEKTDYFNLLHKKIEIYSFIDKINTQQQIDIFRIFVEQTQKK